MLNSFLSCFPRYCLECAQGPSFSETVSYKRMKNDQIVRLDVAHMGSEVVILKEGERICGTGSALGNVPIVQNKAYFQVNVQQTGAWAIGIATSDVDLNECPPKKGFHGLNEKGELVSNGEFVAKSDKIIDEGDSVGVTYDHLELKFYVNGQVVAESINSIRGKMFPCIFVDDSAILDVKFKSFSYQPPSSDFSEILIEQTLL